MATSRNGKIRVNRKKDRRNTRPLIVLAIVALLIIVAVIVIDSLFERQRLQRKPDLQSAAEKHKLPPRQQNQQKPFVHDDYTAMVVPHEGEERHVRVRPRGSGNLAIIIDDMGKGMQEARSIIDIGVPVTFAIIPGLPKVRQVAQEAQRRGIETMIHIPLEPKGYPERRMEDNGILLSHSNEEIAARVNGYLREIPQAVGANNHMGSAFTENRDKMAVVLGVLKGKGLFFIDSKTSAVSVGETLAREMGIRSASRAVFLDNIQDVGYISKQILQAAAIARKRGSAIAICHPHAATIQALALELPKLRDEGISFIPASSLVR